MSLALVSFAVVAIQVVAATIALRFRARAEDCRAQVRSGRAALTADEFLAVAAGAARR